MAEHLILRNSVNDLARAFNSQPRARIEASLQRVISLAGPRLQYQEEALYPDLRDIIGNAAVRALVDDHDHLIDVVGVVYDLLSVKSLSAEDRREAETLVKSVIPGLTRSFGLGLLFDMLPSESVQRILTTRGQAIRNGVNLLEWSRDRLRLTLSLPVFHHLQASPAACHELAR